MKKPMYSVEEIHNLLLEIEKLDTDGLEDRSIVKQALSSFVLCSEEMTHKYDAFQSIAHEAYVLEQRAKSLRIVVRMFKKPLKDLPKDINDSNPIISNIARWRLNLGR